MDPIQEHPSAAPARGEGSVRILLPVRVLCVVVTLTWGMVTGFTCAGLPDAELLVVLHAATSTIGLVVTFAVFTQHLFIRDGVLYHRRPLSVASIPLDELCLLQVDDAASTATLVATDGHPALRLDVAVWPRRRLEAFFGRAGVRVMEREADG